MDIRPFIGIRGWTHPDETGGICRVLDSLDHAPTRMFGVIVNVNGITLVESESAALRHCGNRLEHARLFPPTGNIAGRDGGRGIFVDHPHAVNFVFADDIHEMLLDYCLELIVERSGPLLHGIIIGASWPHTWTVSEFREKHPSLRLVLRVTRDAVRALGRVDDLATAVRVGARVKEYGVTDVLLNLSGPSEEGGLLFDAELVRQYLRAIRVASPGVGLVAAGGFGAKLRTLAPLESLLPEFPDLSVCGGAALTSVANCIDAGSAVGFYLNAEPISAKNEEAAASEAQFQKSVAAFKRVWTAL